MLDSLRVMKERVFGAESPKPIGILVEGGYHDNWRTHTTTEMKFPIPPDCGVIHVWSYDLTLIGKITDKGIEVNPNWENQAAPSVDLDTYTGIERPTTVITEDGRIYHDLELMLDEYNSSRLPSFLTALNGKRKDRYPSIQGLEALEQRINEYRASRLTRGI